MTACSVRHVQAQPQRNDDTQCDSSLRNLHRRPVAFGRIRLATQRNAEGLCRVLLPKGRQHGCRWMSPLPWGGGAIGGSLSVNLMSGRWINHATGAQGDSLIKLAAFVWRIDRWQAALRLAERLGVDPYK